MFVFCDGSPAESEPKKLFSGKRKRLFLLYKSVLLDLAGKVFVFPPCKERCDFVRFLSRFYYEIVWLLYTSLREPVRPGALRSAPGASSG